VAELQDFTGMKRTEKVVIPLNGVRYHGLAEVAGETFLDLVPQSGGAEAVAELPEGVTMDDLANLDPATAAKLDRSGAAQMVKMVQFLEEVLEPASWTDWQANMRRPAKGLTPAKRQQHLDRMITIPQMAAVFRALVSHYAGRPTGPSSSSSNGDGGTGGTSTAGAPAAG